MHDLGEKQDASGPDGQSQTKDRMFSCGPLDPDWVRNTGGAD